MNAGGVRPNNVTPTFGYGPLSSSPHKPLGNKTNTPPKPRGGYHGAPKPGKTPTSSLPRPIPNSKHQHNQHGNGYLPAHMPTYRAMGESGYVIPRIPSTASVGSNSGFSIFNAMGGGRKGSRRESFKPRPSVDGSMYDMGASINGPNVGRQWAEFVDRTLKEEEEY